MIIGIGIPCAGKTTYLKPYAKENGYLYICPDELSAQESEIAWWDVLKPEIINSLQKTDKIIIELAAASYWKIRTSLIKFLRDNGVEKIGGFYFPISPELAKERNNAKPIQKQVPIETINEMYQDLQDHLPIIKDGFDYIEIIGVQTSERIKT